MKFLDFIKKGDHNSLSKLPLWSGITFLVLLYGYIGFFTVCYNRNIPLQVPSFQVAAAIGVYILLYVILLLVLHPEKGYTKVNPSLAIGLIFQYISTNFIVLGTFTLIYLLFYSDVVWAYIQNRPRKEKLPTEERSGSDFIWTLIILFLGIFVSYNLLIVVALSTYFFIELDYIIEKERVQSYHLFLTFILIPLFISNSYLKDAKYNIAGVSQQPISCVNTQNDTTNFILVYQDQDNYYLKKEISSEETSIRKKSDFSQVIIKKPELGTTEQSLFKYFWKKYYEEGKSDSLNNDVKSQIKNDSIVKK